MRESQVENNDTETHLSQDKKPWTSLELKTMTISTDTKSGSNRLDPAEGFILYRPS